jgi:RNA polymerase subunit RPABC4/transcription elongation factor Spt4
LSLETACYDALRQVSEDCWLAWERFHTYAAADSEFWLALSYNIGNRLAGATMLYCQRCKKVTTDVDLVFCPKCGEVLVEQDTKWQDFELQQEVELAKHRANMYVILAIVLVTLGVVGSSVLFASSSLLGVFGIVLVCLGIGCIAAVDRYEYKLRILKNRLSQCD